MKKITALLLVCSMVLLMSACGNSTTQKTEQPVQDKKTEETKSEQITEKAEEKDAKKDSEKDTKEAMGEELHFKLAENQPEGNPITEGMKMFAELAAKYTDGTVKIEVYPSAALVDEASSIDQIMVGSLDFSRVNTNALASSVDLFGAFGMPYLFADTESKYKALDGKAGELAINTLKEHNIIGLHFYEAGSRNFYTTKKAVKSAADLKGMKIRVQQTEVAISMVKALGAEATPMDYGEVFQGLQTGIVDGAENDFVSYYTSGHYEVAKNFTLDGHMSPPAILICSQKAWDKMSDAQKEGVMKASKEAADWQRKAMQDFQLESRAKCEAAGCTIIDVDVKEFQEAVKTVYDQYPQYNELVRMIKEVQ